MSMWGQGVRSVKNLKIRKKIILFYITLIVVSILLSMFIYNRTNAYYLNSKIKELTISEIESHNRSLELLVEDINNYSKTLLSNQTLQSILTYEDSDLTSHKSLDRELAEFINFNHKISSIYVFENDGNRYYAEKEKLKNIHLYDIQSMYWYEDMVQKRGGYVMNFNGNGLFKADKNYLTFFRVINALDTLEPVGLMMINISQEAIEETLGLSENEDTFFVIENIEGKDTMTINSIDGIDIDRYINDLFEKDQLWLSEKVYNTQMVVIGINNNQYGWRLLKITPFDGQTTQMNIFRTAMLAIILLNGILVFFGSFFISRFITNPINKLIVSMKEVERGNFYPVVVETHNDEIGMLKNGYNFMIKEIQKLIREIINEQKSLKKAEFSVIMEQIKPHFLYNTLDSISSLIVLNRSDEAYKSLRALGSFYRTSLSDGRNMITVENEMQIIKNYLYIQNIRYGDLFDVHYEVDPEVIQYKVPKLILQPIVENSIYHGIRPLGEKGIIDIAVKKVNEQIILTVTDNGIGMTEEKVESLNSCTEKSVGIPATKERIVTLYGNKSQFEISSNQRDGTRITIKLPWEVDA